MKLDTCKTPGTLHYMSLGDVHLGHNQTPTEHIIRNLDTYCTNETVLKDVDLLIITGDLFDRLLHNADDNVVLIQRWITRLLFKCSYLNVALRIVEGTPSHDRGQSRFFVEQKQNAGIEVDLHYATTLSIEYLERWDIHILYVPDKWRSDTSETWEEVQELLVKHNLKQVDFAIMHGAFSYQLPAMVPEPTFVMEDYLSIVRYHILVGHVHIASQWDRILAAGSFDRIAHGEEGPKGLYDVRLQANGEAKITFIENKGAKRYCTIDVRGLPQAEVDKTLRELLKTLPEKSAVRLRCTSADPIGRELDSIRRAYPAYQWSVLVETDKETVSVVDALNTIDLSMFVDITAENVVELVQPELARLVADPADRARITQRLLDAI